MQQTVERTFTPRTDTAHLGSRLEQRDSSHTRKRPKKQKRNEIKPACLSEPASSNATSTIVRRASFRPVLASARGVILSCIKPDTRVSPRTWSVLHLLQPTLFHSLLDTFNLHLTLPLLARRLSAFPPSIPSPSHRSDQGTVQAIV